ncbi:MAG: hypothetical protein ABEJ02_05020 [Candidatus Paceibacteria bacterium]
MNRHLKQITIFFTFSLLLVPGVFVSAQTEKTTSSSKNKVFNIDYIISDKEMQNSDSMTVGQIQAFLEGKDSFLASYRTKDLDGEKKSAAEIIHQAAIEHKINPKYLLVKLQKEQSLINDPDPTQKQLDWATGYGVCDGCRLADADVQQHKGFAHQVDSAAGIIRWYYNNDSNKEYIKQPAFSYKIDGKMVEPTNFATAFLYTYTPHIHGNKNFWKIWQKWFDQKYPDGSLLKAYGDNDVYLIQNDKKRRFTSYSAFSSRYDTDEIIEVTKSELERYETGREISLPNYAVLKSGSDYYLVDHETLRPFASRETVRYLGYHPAEIIEVNSEDISHYEIGREITKDKHDIKGKLVEYFGRLYYIKGDKYRSVLDRAIAQVNFPGLNIRKADRAVFQNKTEAEPIKLKDGAIFGIEGSNKIYVVENGTKRHIPDEQTFNSLGYSWDDIVWLNPQAGALHPTGEPIFRKTKSKN